jgi:hypothetical protein
MLTKGKIHLKLNLYMTKKCSYTLLQKDYSYYFHK